MRMFNRPDLELVEMGHGVQPLTDDLQYAGHGFPVRDGEDRPGMSPWGRLVKGWPLGKKSVLLYDSENEDPQIAKVPIVQLQGSDLDACQIALTLGTPYVINTDPDTIVDLQNASGEASNWEVPGANFPGTAAPIKWPAIKAIVEWGIGGHKTFAVVDFIAGTVINLHASFLRVTPAILQPQLPTGTSAAYVLAGFVGPGYTKSGNAQNTIYVGGLEASAESNVFPVPAFSKRAYVVGAQDVAAPDLSVGTLRFWQDPGGLHNVGNFFFSGNQLQPVNVPNGAQYFSVLSGTGDTTRFSAIFDLSI